MPESPSYPELQQALHNFFGFERLRPGQEEVVRAAMEGRDTLAIMPTGGGKSLCYQLPALCRAGLTVVVSPLIALMKDQVDALQARGIPAAAINSSLGTEEYRQVMAGLRAGELKILYVAPERFAQEGFMRALSEWPIALLAVDEAHCLSQWGHDFRPDYLRLGRAREALGFPQTMALTATATEAVRQDIVSTLQLREPAVVISGFARDNLDFRVVPCGKRADKFERIAKTVAQWGQGIIYCSTRKNVMLVYEELRGRGIRAVAYHAGMTDEERSQSQEDFISRRADVAVATNAFGMGIDRADVRFVIHFEIPGSVEAYYQEAGRAGRDGEPAVCELLFNHADLKTQEFFYEGSNPPRPLLRLLYAFLCRNCHYGTHELQLSADAMCDALGKDANPMAVSTGLGILARAGAIERFDVAGSLVRGTRVLHPESSFDALDIPWEELEEKALRDHRKIEAITRYAYSGGCRQQWILNYFGETGSEPCGHCDGCCPEEDEEAVVLEGEELLTVRKALSGVARAGRRRADGVWEGIYGRGKIIDMLRAAPSVAAHPHLSSLSTFGLLREMSETKVKALFRALHKGGLVMTTGEEYPLLALSAAGEAVMLGRAEAKLSRRGWARAPRAPEAARRKRVQALVESMTAKLDKALYERLCEQRRDIAAECRVPAYRVLHSEALRALATVKPTTIEGALRLKGIGARVNRRWLQVFLELIQEHEGL
ncbi:MAG: RecQ family ATP-dependent DNA helicase [Akkermansia sp.]